jgi:hypothetical protein
LEHDVDFQSGELRTGLKKSDTQIEKCKSKLTTVTDFRTTDFFSNKRQESKGWSGGRGEK